MTRALLQQALDALDTCDAHLEVSGMNYGYYFNQEAVHNAVKALATTLAQTEPTSVLWVMTTPIGGRKFVIESESEAKRFVAMGDRSVVPFYSAPDTYRNPADDELPYFWWNGLRDDRSFSESEDTWHDIPMYAGVNPSRCISSLAHSAVTFSKTEQSGDGWLEATIAWEVCASIHEKFAKGKDALYKKRHADFVKHVDACRAKAIAAPPAPDIYRNPADDAERERSFEAMEIGIVAELRKELADMTAQRDRLMWGHAQVCEKADTDRLDAQRYRWLRDTTKAIRDDSGENRIAVTPNEFTAAIDAAMGDTNG
jgi:hypothetical protein